MTPRAQNELALIKTELRNIIAELESIERGVRNDFQGIGNDICANSLKAVLDDRLYKAQRTLNNMNTSNVREEFKATHGG